MQLGDFLRQRLDEDLAIATPAADAGSGNWDAAFQEDEGNWTVEDREFSDPSAALDCTGDWAMAAHIARHDPARVIREVEAKRKEIALHVAEPGQHPDFCWYDRHQLPCPSLRNLASVYSDHSDYREEWRL